MTNCANRFDEFHPTLIQYRWEGGKSASFWFSSNLHFFLPTQVSVEIGGECVMCHGFKLADSLGWMKLSNFPGKQQLVMNFWLVHDQAVPHETTANLCPSWHQANNFSAVFPSFELGGLTKHFMTDPVRCCEFCFSSTSVFPEAKTLK